MIRNLKILKMKNKLKIIFLVALGALIFTTCEKDPNLPMPDLQMTVIPLITKDLTKDANLSFLDLPGFAASVIVDVYNNDEPQSMNLMVCMNDSVANTGILTTGITTFPTTTDFTLGTLIDALTNLDDIGEVKLGDEFKLYVDMTLKDGTVIYGNSPLYSSFDPAVRNLPGSSLNVTYSVACALDPALMVGSYRAVCDDWGVDGNVTITADPVDPNLVYVTGLETIDGLDEDKGPLPMHIDPMTYEVTAPKTVLASLVTWGAPYHDIAYEGTGTYNTCTGTYEMKFNITVTEGNFGDFNFILTRN